MRKVAPGTATRELPTAGVPNRHLHEAHDASVSSASMQAGGMACGGPGLGAHIMWVIGAARINRRRRDPPALYR